MEAAEKQPLAEAAEIANSAVRHPWIQSLAQFGFYTKGFLFIVIGAIAMLVVAGVRDVRMADARGALAEVAKEPYGHFLLLIFVVGAIGHGLWNVLRAAADVDGLGRNWKAIVSRSIQGLIGCFYIGMAASAIEIVLAASVSSESSQAEETFAGVLLAIPLIGASFIAIIGLGLIGAGFTECYRGVTGKFQDVYRTWEIRGFHRAFITFLGLISFTARALLLAIMGWFFVRAAVDNSSRFSIGLDAALLSLLNTPYGRIAVTLTALGLIGHGILAFYEARFRRIC